LVAHSRPAIAILGATLRGSSFWPIFGDLRGSQLIEGSRDLDVKMRERSRWMNPQFRGISGARRPKPRRFAGGFTRVNFRRS